MFRFLVQAGSVRLQESGHLVDKCTGSAGTDAVHALLQTTFEIDDLGVFAAKFDGDICLGCHELQSGCNCDHFLYERNIQCFTQIDRT